MNKQNTTILVTVVVTLAVVGLCFFAEKQLDKERLKYANMGAQTVRNFIYEEVLEKGSVRVEALFPVEGEEKPEVKSIILYPDKE